MSINIPNDILDNVCCLLALDDRKKIPGHIIDALEDSMAMLSRAGSGTLGMQTLISIMFAAEVNLPKGKRVALKKVVAAEPVEEKAESTARTGDIIDWKKVKNGTEVIAAFNGKQREGRFLCEAGGSEKGKLRIEFAKDDKSYREIPAEQVVLK